MSSDPPPSSSAAAAAAAPGGPRHAPPETNPLRGGCPVAHGSASAAAVAGGCPVAHGGAPAAASPHGAAGGAASAAALSAGCPVAHSRAAEPSPHGSPRPAAPGGAHPFQYAKPQHFPGLTPQGEEVPANSIPAAGRGNSEDGKAWLNPSANQLFRALMRKDKPIEAEDAGAVAAVHVAVTDNTWAGIMEYEKLHASSCPAPTLARFQGMDGHYSLKAKMIMGLWGMRPFDRHDWYVNRCGKEVKYVIDYYSFETPDAATGETSIDYFIDARPAPTMAGLYDRARVAFAKWKRGEKVW